MCSSDLEKINKQGIVINDTMEDISIKMEIELNEKNGKKIKIGRASCRERV